MLDLLTAGVAGLGVRLDEPQIERFERYVALIRDWSTRMNLVGDASVETVVRRHVLESLALGAALRQREILRPSSSIIDVGAGAGFPGIPLKIAWPTVSLSLLEATRKKVDFLDAAIAALQLTNASTIHARAETAGHDPKLREQFDLVVARAVTALPALLELTLPFARVGGRVVAPKGSRASSELRSAANALSTLGGEAHTLPFDVAGPPQQLIVVIKRRPTPDAYPRRDGVPARTPL